MFIGVELLRDDAQIAEQCLRALEVGKGRHIDVSMQAAMVAALGPRMGETLQAGISPKSLGNQNPMRAPSDVYITSDGVHCFIMVQNDRHWAPLPSYQQRCPT